MSHPVFVHSDSKRLWLPASYQYLLPQLRKAASIVEETPRCQKILRGERIEALSTDEHPMFRIICRDSNFMSYPVVVDGKTFAVQQNEDGGKKERHKRFNEKYWAICTKALEQRASAMQNLKWHFPTEPKPTSLTTDLVTYELDFDATSVSGEALRYRGFCRFSSISEFEIDLKPRSLINSK
ncbi:hypothetical protein [Marinibactrum halimedae]|uniref:Uncharacterized protein n=1 Tax=Marinibactrum halimedae TaxID=1444977 RepID=A0AA37T7J0_9GAMM|nr:hypothetical protein [Marinibactrum halimedae]MCD9459904.1 hypothetical protein [Marinibactrum halimedae]GLS25241.1 hypothetical protein GCM10007877_09550 [Marinibactrum halimedae]